MKYALLVGDGMSDRPLPALDGKTPLEVAKIPVMCEIASRGILGTVSTIPKGMSSASDVANLSILGYDPKKYYTGRGPLEAANIGVKIEKDEIAFRCNFVTAANTILSDYSAGHITDRESPVLIDALNSALGSERIKFHHGTSYRNLVVIRARSASELRELSKVVCVPPHNITGQEMKPNLPKGSAAAWLIEIMEASRAILEKHDVNKVRLDLKENPANMIWLWGQGTDPHLPPYSEMYGISGGIISAVDLLKGIGRLIGLNVIDVPGATGYYDTNYKGKGEAALACLERSDFVFVHVEAPDEAGHNGDLRQKLEAIENFDKHVVAPLWNVYKERKGFRILIMPDHATPIAIKTHVDDPVPFAMAGEGIAASGIAHFNETAARETKVKVKSGALLTEQFFKSAA